MANEKWYKLVDSYSENDESYYGIHIKAFSGNQARLKIKDFLKKRGFVDAASEVYHHHMKIVEADGPAPKKTWGLFSCDSNAGCINGIEAETNNLADAMLMLCKRGLPAFSNLYVVREILKKRNPKSKELQLTGLFG